MINHAIKILLIEDNPGDARLIRELLAEANDVLFDIEWANQLSKGLDHLSAESFDAILLDLSLPDSFGIDTLLNVKKQAPKIPILILTGLDDESIALKALREGAQETEGAVRPSSRALDRQHGAVLETGGVANLAAAYRLPVAAKQKPFNASLRRAHQDDFRNGFARLPGERLTDGDGLQSVRHVEPREGLIDTSRVDPVPRDATLAV